MRRLGWRIPVTALALLGVLACVPKAGPPSKPPPDLAPPVLAAIGGPCNIDGDCASQLCWVSNFLNDSQKVTTPGGYCTRACTTDGDCGSGAVCQSFGSSGSFCLQSCMAASDCRSPGYGCWSTGVCFSSENFDCTPTSGNGTCTTGGGAAGGCIRYALGSGKVGVCTQSCEVGVATCPSSGGAQICIFIDMTQNLDGTSTGDKYRGTICEPAGTPQHTDGTECTAPDGMGGTTHFSDACVDGDECYLRGGQAPGHGFDASGDNKCHALCNPPGTSGSVAAPCGGGLTCRDIFGSFTTTNPVGLCLP